MRLEKEEEVEDAEAEDENEEANGYVREREVEEEGEEDDEDDNDEKAGSLASNVVADDNRLANCALFKLRNRSNKNWGSVRTECKISSKSDRDCGLNCKKKSGERSGTESRSDRPSSNSGSCWRRGDWEAMDSHELWRSWRV